MGRGFPYWTQRPCVPPGEGWAPSGCTLPVTHHVMKISLWSGGYVNKKSESIRAASFTKDKQWKDLCGHFDGSRQSSPNWTIRLDSLLYHLPSVDRMSLWNRPRDLLSMLKTKLLKSLKFFDTISYDVHAHCFGHQLLVFCSFFLFVFHTTLNNTAGRQCGLLVMQHCKSWVCNGIWIASSVVGIHALCFSMSMVFFFF